MTDMSVDMHSLQELHEDLAAGCSLVTIDGRDYLETKRGTHYDTRTPAAVIRAIEAASSQAATKLGKPYLPDNRRVRLCYGDVEGPDAGRDWHQKHDFDGHIGYAIGDVRLPILCPNSRKLSGIGILTHCLVLVAWNVREGDVLYRHPQYRERQHRIRKVRKPPRYVVERYQDDGTWLQIARFPQQQYAARYLSNLSGRG